ncbi:MAG TPA: hypothetical protein VMT95_05750 [Candidatus Binatia bacterium]|nr:hypothetical protein [Candidatus Binatia bacterium]
MFGGLPSSTPAFEAWPLSGTKFMDVWFDSDLRVLMECQGDYQFQADGGFGALRGIAAPIA